MSRLQLDLDQIRTLPPVVDVPTAAAVLGIGRTAAYELIRTDSWPTPVVRLGKLIRVPTAPLLDLVGVRR
ncbi:DNA-binding protein [Kineococcus terrestris]|uniref:DNA-binding protein n=1 Tax=Kineococcus terrestris TaxID=2044856 RepID=UPI0034DB1EA8